MGKQLNKNDIKKGIEDDILNGSIEPGSRLVQLKLAEKYGVCQSVIREALLELTLTGMVECEEDRGFFVVDLDLECLLQAYEVREVIEGLAARRCCDHVSRKQMQELSRLNDESFHYAEEGDMQKKISSDRKFHGKTIEFSKNRFLERLQDSYRLFGMAVYAGRPAEEVYKEHKQIVEAIKNYEPENAENFARRHVRKAREAILERNKEVDFKMSVR